MYQERIAKVIADHLRTHIKAYLAEVEGWYTADQTATLVVPKAIDVAGQVGGVLADLDKNFPRYACDVLTKTEGGQDENLWLYTYTGHLAGIVSAGSESAVGSLVKRHSAAVELFIRRHYYMHQEENNQFSIMSLRFLDSDFSGAEEIQVGPKERPIWVDAFRIDFSVGTSEDGPDQHIP